MNGMTNLVMLLIAMHGGAQSPPVYRYAAASVAAVGKRSPMRTDAVICKDGQVHTFPAGQRKPCI
ncbi:hypothetical protein [Burkholderia cenocepacia]|uniref:hypothetical protein n=1 Tax=Burkholderia cenocepacia TaxID=95486 RepID=UPI002AB5EA92|nr:hypothetical protein [Burkholderia cenocepacia]